MKVLAAALCLILSAERVTAQEGLLFTTESYPPFIFQDEAAPVRGSSVDQVKSIMSATGIPYRIEVMPWARAIALAETQPSTCVFSAAQTAERQARFKWVMPLAKSRSILVKHKHAGVTANSLDDARLFTIGTHRSDYTETLLRTLKFPKIDISSTFDVTLSKLLSDRIELMPMPQDAFDRLHKRGVEIEKVAQLAEQQLGIACNKAVPSHIIKTMQAALDRMIADGTQAEIYRLYGLEPPH